MLRSCLSVKIHCFLCVLVILLLGDVSPRRTFDQSSISSFSIAHQNLSARSSGEMSRSTHDQVQNTLSADVHVSLTREYNSQNSRQSFLIPKDPRTKTTPRPTPENHPSSALIVLCRHQRLNTRAWSASRAQIPAPLPFSLSRLCLMSVPDLELRRFEALARTGSCRDVIQQCH